MFFFFLFLSLANCDLLNLTNSPTCGNFTQDLILCEGLDLGNITTKNTTFTLHYVAKHITSKNYTTIVEYTFLIGNSTIGDMELALYLVQLIPLLRYKYNHDICTSNYSTIVYTDTTTLDFTSGTLLFSHMTTNSTINMYNHTNLQNLTMCCNNNETTLPNKLYSPEKTIKNCIFNDKVIYTEVITEKKHSKC